MDYRKSLSAFSLDENEQHVIVTLNSTGWITVLQLSKVCRMKRTTLYRVLKRLLVKGLIQEKRNAKTTFYTSSGLSAFESMVRDEEQKHKKKVSALKDLALHLFVLPSKTRTNITYYYGFQGLEQIIAKAFTYNSDFSIFSSHSMQKSISKVVNNTSVSGEKRTFRVLVNESAGDFDKSKNLQIKTVSKERIKITHSIAVSGLHTFIFEYRNRDFYGIGIENEMVSIMVQHYFKSIWEDK